MGGSVSAGTDNDDLIDNLIEAKYIRTPRVEKVFRTVDRAFYFLPEFKYSAYRDLAWKHGNLHLSAPCIYSEVLEHLNLEPGMSFLNIGSGTGYLNTMVGLILGSYGINHGIEIQPDVVEYAYERLEQFKMTCNGVDVFEFCEPKFIVGNVFDLSHDRKYDRIYCGAACPEPYHEHIKKYMKIGGILIVPCEDDLLRIVRNSEDSWEMTSVLSVSFSTLQMANRKSANTISMPDPYPLRLEELCRTNIRSILRSRVEEENAELTQKRKRKRSERPRNRRHSMSQVIIPIIEDVSGDDANATRRMRRNRLDFSNIIFHNYSTAAFRNFIRTLRRHEIVDGEDDDQTVGGSDSLQPESVTRPVATNESNRNRVRVRTAGAISGQCWTINIDSGVSPSANNDPNGSSSSSSSEESVEEISNTSADSSSENEVESSRSASSIAGEPWLVVRSDSAVDSEAASSSGSVNEKLPSGTSSNGMNGRTRREGTAKTSQAPVGRGRSSATCRPMVGENAVPQQMCEPNQNIRKQVDDDENEDVDDDLPKKLLKREKLDSGISEESDDYKVSRGSESSSSYSGSTFSETMDLDSDDSGSANHLFFEESVPDGNTGGEIRTAPAYDSLPSLKYRKTMELKIKALPLPQPLKMYLNYNRPFEVSS